MPTRTQFNFPITVRRAMRLHSAAVQLPTKSGAPMPVTTLARLLLADACLENNGIQDRIENEIDPAFIDVTYGARTRQRGYKHRYILNLPVTPELHAAIHATARSRDRSASQLFNWLLEQLPRLPGEPTGFVHELDQ